MEHIQIANKHKRYSTSLFIRETHIKTITRYYCTSLRMSKIKKADHVKCWPGYERTGTQVHSWGEHKMVQLPG